MANPKKDDEEKLARYVDAIFFTGECPEMNDLITSLTTTGLPSNIKRWIFSDTNNGPFKGARQSDVLAVVSPHSKESVAVAGLPLLTPPLTPPQAVPLSKLPDEFSIQLKTPLAENDAAKRQLNPCTTVATTPMSWTPSLQEAASTTTGLENATAAAVTCAMPSNSCSAATMHYAAPPTTVNLDDRYFGDGLPVPSASDIIRYLQSQQDLSPYTFGHGTPAQPPLRTSQNNTRRPILSQSHLKRSSISSTATSDPFGPVTIADFGPAYAAEQVKYDRK